MKINLYRYLRLFFFGTIVSWSLLACSKFDQDFKFKEINEVTIAAEASNYVVVQLEKLHIPVTISTSQSNGDYSYSWKAIAKDSVYLISTEKELNTTIQLPPTDYNLQYTVRDNSNGLEYNKLFKLKVNGVFFGGWLVTHNVGSKGNLTFVRTDDVVFKNPSEELNHQEFPGKAVTALYCEIPSNADYSFIHYFTENQVYRFDPASFLLKGTTKDVLPGVTTFNKVAYGTNLYAYDQYFINNGEVHMGFGMFNRDQMTMPFTVGLGGDYKLFPAVISSLGSSVFVYDNKYKRFLELYYGERTANVFNTPTSTFYNMGNVGKTMLAADKGRLSYGKDVYYFVMEDNGGRYVFGLDGDKPTLNQKVEDAKSPEFSKAMSFATSSVFEHMYYAVANKIYLYNIVANTAQLIYSFPSSVQIKDLKMLRKTSKTLAVATNNGGKGEFHVFEIDNLGRFNNNAPRKSFDGFGDIVSISPR